MSTEREPMKRRGERYDAESRAMNLPDGKTCADCEHCRRCCAIFGHIPADEVCDWYPSRFQPVRTAAALADTTERRPTAAQAEVRLDASSALK